MTVAYLGPRGTFAERAARRLTQSEATELRPASSVVAALDLVRAGEVASAVVPIENSIEGSVSGTLDELSASPALRIIAEVAVPVRFTLMARTPLSLSQITAVGTHPHGAAQCRRWLHDNLPGASVEPTSSTAGAAQQLAEGTAGFDAAIADHLAAEHFDLVSVVDDIADNPEAATRFVQVAPPGPPNAPTGADKTSLLLFMNANRSGALLEILTEFAVRDINMTRLESRPTRKQLGEYCFSVDIDGHVADERVGEALIGLRRACADVVFLGSYPRLDGRSTEIPAGQSDEDYRASREWLAGLREGTPPPSAG